ncbi:hypothetical protein K438DRAFT_12635 [Mycena galopus ATCC 62051]|nr:hypothetical protein K438DRAFT_12635 [Mycena galopus ATCC 62051]
MGCDVLCVICGGPPFRVGIAKSAKARQSSDDEDDEYYTEHGYDPNILNNQDVEWTGNCVLLGFNELSTKMDKTYLTGRARYEDYGCFNVDASEGKCMTREYTLALQTNGRADPNFPDDSPNFQCFIICDATQTSCYPMHTSCLDLLTRVLSGTEGVENIDKDILYHTMANLHSNYASSLDLDYGQPESGFDQYWGSNSGAEMLVVNPMPTPVFSTFLRNAASTTEFVLPAPTVIDSRVRHDPFASVPYDVAHTLLLLLPGHTVRALCTASYPLHAFFGPSNRSFWRVALRICMPWFWELHELMRDGAFDPKTTDYMGLFLWADKQTMPREGLQGPFMGVANRRRIWGVCEQLEEDYTSRTLVKAKEQVRGETPELIWHNSVNVDLPAVAWPKPEDRTRTRTTAAQWICDEMSYMQGGDFEVFWDDEGSLVGMIFAVFESSDPRIFGKTDGASKETIYIESGIIKLVLHLPDIFLREKVQTSIKGVTVLTTSGESHTLGDTDAQYCQRVLSVSPNYALTGVVGHITDASQIIRLGLVQDLVAGDVDDELAPILLHRPLWKAPTPSTSNALHSITSPIWSHDSRLRVLPSTTGILDRYQLQCPYHEDVVPTDVLIWAADAHELRNLQRISAYQPDGDRHIGALRVDFALESGITPRVVGEDVGRRLVEGFCPTWDASPNGLWVPFEIHGAGGEVVTAVDVVHDPQIKTVKLRTNRGREVIWGEELRDYRSISAIEPADGETIIGLAVGFIYPCYSKKYRVELSALSALAMAL